MRDIISGLVRLRGRPLPRGFKMTQLRLQLHAFDGSRIDESTYSVPAHWRLLFRGETSLYDRFFEAAYATRSN